MRNIAENGMEIDRGHSDRPYPGNIAKLLQLDETESSYDHIGRSKK
jgi:hypothetical protein